jgi:hypothetical protein
MHQDYRELSNDDLEGLEKQTLRMIVQALQQYSNEAREIFESTPATSKTEVIVLAEDLTQYALEVAEVYPINKRYAGFIDYKRARWLPHPAGLIPQILLVDAKASTENNRDTLQASQLPMDAEFTKPDGTIVTLPAGVQPHMEVVSATGQPLHAVTTSIFVHFYYRDIQGDPIRFRELMDIFVYNPDPLTTFFGAGKHSPARGEDPRIRVYFTRLRQACAWRLQQLPFAGGLNGYTRPIWRDLDEHGTETNDEFLYLPR